ncbi:hypothetical protein E2C01_086392 [Portunus trituberculatus]|uniref:Uncharacterized protein n=1 Tax=Portunus trituberculatus TaxID=210409 RepID=A0A5B7J0N5_PORTR|nr:hypothetical protein [Portunus trituberculatus]
MGELWPGLGALTAVGGREEKSKGHRTLYRIYFNLFQEYREMSEGRIMGTNSSGYKVGEARLRVFQCCNSRRSRVREGPWPGSGVWRATQRPVRGDRGGRNRGPRPEPTPPRLRLVEAAARPVLPSRALPSRRPALSAPRTRTRRPSPPH